MKASLRVKIVAGFIAAALAALVIGLIGGKSVGDVRDQDARAARQSTEQLIGVSELQLNIIRSNVAAAMMLYGPPEFKPTSVQNLGREATEAANTLGELDRMNLSTEARTSHRMLTTFVSTYNKAYNGLLQAKFPVPDPNAPEVAAPTDTLAQSLAKVNILNANIDKTAATLQQQIAADATAARKTASDNASRSLTLLLLFAAAIGLVIVAFGIWFSGRIVRRIRNTADVLGRVAEGDLTPRVVDNGNDEVAEMGVALNTTLDTVHDVIQEIESDAARLSGYADRMAGTLDELAEYNRLMSESLGKQGLGQMSHDSDASMASSKETATKLAEMAGGLNAMISIFTLRPSADTPAETGAEPEMVTTG